MRVAIAIEGQRVSNHFGHCEGFIVCDIENGQEKEQQFIPNPGHKPGFLPVFLKEKGVEVIIAGGMGEGAQKLFTEKGVEIIVGANGLVEEVKKQYKVGQLKSSEHVCKEHQHAGSCHSH